MIALASEEWGVNELKCVENIGSGTLSYLVTPILTRPSLSSIIQVRKQTREANFLLKATQVISDQVRIQAGSVWFQVLCLASLVAVEEFQKSCLLASMTHLIGVVKQVLLFEQSSLWCPEPCHCCHQ